MQRLGIFVFYDQHGIVSKYVEYLLISLKEIVCYQIVVINGILQEESKNIFLRIADKIYIRENVGFDAGAYKDIFQHFLLTTKLEDYDEIVLCNDSFYGPIFPFSEIWNKIKKYKVDFWGLTRHPGGVFGDGCFFPAHIQSYFLVIRRSLFLSSEFQHFWNNEVTYGKQLIDAVKGFEIKFTEYFEKNGFIGVALTDLLEYSDITVYYNENPYQVYSYELISKRICPVLKRKSLLLTDSYFDKAFGAYRYICEKTSYPEQLIVDHIKRLNREDNWCKGWDLERLERFYLQHKAVYIYGAGQWGKILQTYFNCRKWIVSGILISEGETIVGSEQVFHPDILAVTDGIVIALGKKNVKSVADNLRKVLTEQQLYIPDYK